MNALFALLRGVANEPNDVILIVREKISNTMLRDTMQTIIAVMHQINRRYKACALLTLC